MPARLQQLFRIAHGLERRRCGRRWRRCGHCAGRAPCGRCGRNGRDRPRIPRCQMSQVWCGGLGERHAVLPEVVGHRDLAAERIAARLHVDLVDLVIDACSRIGTFSRARLTSSATAISSPKLGRQITRPSISSRCALKWAGVELGIGDDCTAPLSVASNGRITASMPSRSSCARTSSRACTAGGGAEEGPAADHNAQRDLAANDADHAYPPESACLARSVHPSCVNRQVFRLLSFVFVSRQGLMFACNRWYRRVASPSRLMIYHVIILRQIERVCNVSPCTWQPYG